MTGPVLTDADICRARSSYWIDRDTYEAAMYGDSEAIDRVCSAFNSRRRRDWTESVTP